MREILSGDETEFLVTEAVAKASFDVNAMCALLAQCGARFGVGARAALASMNAPDREGRLSARDLLGFDRPHVGFVRLRDAMAPPRQGDESLR